MTNLNHKCNCQCPFCKNSKRKLTKETLDDYIEKSKETDLVPDNCWIWKRSVFQQSGYGRIKINQRTYVAHRVVYEMIKGEIPEGLQLDHLCRVRQCVNPNHLEPVTARENQKRGISPISRRIDATHCHKGHEYTPENTFYRKNGKRLCKTCKKIGEDLRRPKYRDKINEKRRKK